MVTKDNHDTTHNLIAWNGREWNYITKIKVFDDEDDIPYDERVNYPIKDEDRFTQKDFKKAIADLFEKGIGPDLWRE